VGQPGNIRQVPGVLRRKKKLILDIAEWVESRGRNRADDPGNWRFDGDTVKTTPASAIIRIWEAYKKSGVLPEPGGWLDQPLDILVQIGAIDTVYETYEYKNSESVKYEKFTPTQRAIIREVERAATVG